MKESSGGVAAIVCDTTGNTVRQGCCYTCLAIRGDISVGSLRLGGLEKALTPPRFKIPTRMELLFKSLRGLQLQLSGVCRIINLHYSYSFLVMGAACSYRK